MMGLSKKENKLHWPEVSTEFSRYNSHTTVVATCTTGIDTALTLTSTCTIGIDTALTLACEGNSLVVPALSASY